MDQILRFLSQNLSISCLGENEQIAILMSGEDVILNCRYQICLDLKRVPSTKCRSNKKTPTNIHGNCQALESLLQ